MYKIYKKPNMFRDNCCYLVGVFARFIFTGILSNSSELILISIIIKIIICCCCITAFYAW